MKVFKDAKIIDMCSGPEPKRGNIIVEDDIIVAVNYNDIEIPDRAEEICLAGKYILPGLIDCHTHLCMTTTLFELEQGIGQMDDNNISFFAVRNAIKALTGGVTTVRDVGGQNYIELKLKRFIEAGHIIGPRIYAAGKVITTTGGHLWKIGEEADTEDEIEKAIKKQVRAGAFLIKMIISGGVLTASSQPYFLQYDVPLIKRAIEVSHELDRKVTGHIGNKEAFRAALEAGIDCIEHFIPEDEEDLEIMVKKGIFCVPTIVTYPLWASSAKRWDAPEFFLAKKKKQKPDYKRNLLANAYKSGLKMVAGTDAGASYIPFGHIVDELKIYTECGFSNYEAIAAATSLASELIGETRIGTIRKGNWADMIVIEDNPLDNILALRNPEIVVKGGEIIFQGRPNIYYKQRECHE